MRLKKMVAIKSLQMRLSNPNIKEVVYKEKNIILGYGTLPRSIHGNECVGENTILSPTEIADTLLYAYEDYFDGVNLILTPTVFKKYRYFRCDRKVVV